jgi:hypothetical protein
MMIPARTAGLDDREDTTQKEKCSHCTQVPPEQHSLCNVINPSCATPANCALPERRHTLNDLARSKANPRSVSRPHPTAKTWFRRFNMPAAGVACAHPVILIGSAPRFKSGIVDAKKSGNLLGASCREIRFSVQTGAQEPRERQSAGSGDQRSG